MLARNSEIIKKIGIMMICILLITPGCAKQEEKQEEKPVVTQEQSDLVAAENDFAFSLLTKLYGQDTYTNTSISGTSAYIALCMLANGAKSPCLEEMMTAMGLDGQDIKAINQFNSKFIHKQYGDDISIVNSNSIWVGKDAMIVDDFANTVKTQYSATAEKIDFSDEKSPETINSWVEKSTNGKIKDLVNYDEIKDALMMLINALYLKAPWTNTFNPKLTSDQDFVTLPGKPVKVKMMNRLGFYQYHKGDGFDIVRLPYGQKEELAMYIVLPEAKDGLITLSEFFDRKEFELQLAKMKDTEINLQLPRTKIEFEADLVPLLKKMGMNAIFDGSISDLSGMIANPQNAFVSLIKHKTYINIDEAGTEAAAVTAVEMVGSAAPGEKEPKEFKVDHPFMTIIRDEATGEVVFSAFVTEP
ncbi:MAG: serpin family protein [Caldisericia bacterium]|nr:serpin family protein [Caldisericia bacterium]